MKKSNKSLFTVLLSGILILNIFGGLFQKGMCVQQTLMGSGAESDPYQISTPEELAILNNYLGNSYTGKVFKLMNDIDLTTYLSVGNSGYNGGAGWEPIGSWFPNFSGVFDGGGHKITGLWINRPNFEFIGLFGRIDGGEIKNLGVEISNEGIKGYNHVGGIAGDVGNGTVKNCYVSGVISGNDFVGGLIGYAGGSNSYIVNITNCYASSNVSVNYEGGGLIGHSSGSGIIEKCYSTGNVSTESVGRQALGGLIGGHSNGKIKNCYATGNVLVNNADAFAIGGFVGFLGQYGTGNIENCYSTGSASGIENYSGGFVGNRDNSAISNCFFDKDSAEKENGVGEGNNSGVTSKTTAEMKTKSTFTNAGWDFNNIWNINEKRNSGYPFFRSSPAPLASYYKFEPELAVFDKSQKQVFVTRTQAGENAGANENIATIYYNGSTAAPAAIGTYKVTIDVAGNEFFNIATGLDLGEFNIVEAATEHNIIYKNYDGSDIKNLDSSFPTKYIEGEGLTLPTIPPNNDMADYEFLGFWDCPLDQNSKTSVPGVGYEDEQTLDLTVGNKITEIPADSSGDITLYTRYTSKLFDEDINGRENYIFAAPGVFPNGSAATMTVLEPGTEEYQNTLKEVDEENIDKIKIVEFKIHDKNGNKIQPNTFFGNAVVGFKIPDGYDVDDISLIRVVANGEDITLRSKIWVDPENSNLKYIEGTTDHFSPYAILNPWNESFPSVATGDQSWLLITSLSTVLVVSAGVLIWIARKKKKLKS